MKKLSEPEVFLILCLIIALAPWVISGRSDDSLTPPALGTVIDDFELPDANGVRHSLTSLAGEKGTILVFIAAKCPVSNAYNDRISRIFESFARQGVNVVGINSNDTETASDIKSHAEQNHFNFTILKDSSNKIADRLGVTRAPEAYLLDANRKLVYYGRIDDSATATVTSNDLRNSIDDLLAGVPVHKGTTVPFGCQIRRSSVTASLNDSESIAQGRGGEGSRARTPRLGQLTTGRCPVFSPDGRTIAVCRDTSIYLIDIFSGVERKLGDSPTKTAFTSLAFSPDGKTLASGGHDFTVRLWTIATGQMRVLKKLAAGGEQAVNTVAFSPNGQRLAASTTLGENTVYVWDLPSLNPQTIGRVFGAVTLSFLDNSTLVAGGFAGHLIKFDLTRMESKIIGSTPDGIGSFTISADKVSVVSAGRYSTVRLWNLQNGQGRVLLPFLPQNGGRVSVVAFSQDGKTLVTAGDGLFVWNSNALLAHGEIQNINDFAILPFRRIPISNVDSVSFSPNGQWLLVRNNLETVSLLASNSEQLGSESSSTSAGPPLADVKRTGKQTWRIILPPHDWYDTGLPVIAGVSFRVESEEKVLTRINNKLEASRNPMGNNPLGNGPGPLAPAIAYPSRPDMYYLYLTLCDRCRLTGELTVDPDFVDTLKLKSYDNKSGKTLELSVWMDFTQCSEYNSGDNIHRELHDKAIKQFQSLLAKIPYR